MLRLENGSTTAVENEKVLLACNAEEGDVTDNTSLSHLSDATLLHNLRSRFLRQEIYTFTCQILIAVNPYRDLNDKYYSQEIMERYVGRPVRGRI